MSAPSSPPTPDKNSPAPLSMPSPTVREEGSPSPAMDEPPRGNGRSSDANEGSSDANEGSSDADEESSDANVDPPDSEDVDKAYAELVAINPWFHSIPARESSTTDRATASAPARSGARSTTTGFTSSAARRTLRPPSTAEKTSFFLRSEQVICLCS